MNNYAHRITSGTTVLFVALLGFAMAAALPARAPDVPQPVTKIDVADIVALANALFGSGPPPAGMTCQVVDDCAESFCN